jgi:hypothetical protein
MQFPKTSTELQNDRFNLKHEAVDLLPQAPRPERAHLTVAELEAVRTGRPAVSASKHGLEAICGASCEIGAH